MTHQQQFLLVLLALPFALAAGLLLGHLALLRYLTAGVRGENRPVVRLGRKVVVVVTPMEYEWLRLYGKLEDAQ